MASPLSQFISDRFIKPQVDAQVATILAKSNSPLAYGLSAIQETSFKDAIGQPPDANYALLYAIYGVNADVATCVRLIAGGVIAEGWKIALMDPDGKPTATQQKKIDELSLWLKNPNPSKRFSLILSEIATHLLISGDAYQNKVKGSKQTITEIWVIHPATMRVVADQFGAILGYVQQVNGSKVNFKPEEISHFRLSNPINDLYGRSPLESALEEIRGDLSALRANTAIFENGMSPSMILLMNEKSTPDQAQKATDAINANHKGVSKWRKLLAISQVNKVEPYGNTLKDMEFSQLRDLATTKVAAAFGVPKFLLGMKDAADFATSDVLERQFYTTTIKPLQDVIEEVMTEDIIHAFDPELKFEFNQPELRSPDAVSTTLLSAHDKGIVDDDEIRQIVLNLPPKELDPNVEEDSTTTTGSDSANDAEDNADEAGADATNAPDKKPAKNPAKKAVIKSLPDLAMLSADREAEKDLLAAEFAKPVTSFFTAQEQRYLSKLSSGAFKLTKARIPRASDSDNPELDDYVQDAQADALLDAVFVAALVPSLSAGAQAAQLQIEITLRFDQINPIVQRYLQTDALTHVQAINETTRNLLRGALTQGIEAGEGVPELAARISKVFETAKTSRSTLIARNEVAEAYEFANRQAAIATGLNLLKQWLTSGSERVCPVCLPMDGETTPLDQPYSNGLEPGAAHILCMCSEVYKTVE